MFDFSHSLIVSSVGAGSTVSNALTDMTKPDVQKPH
jgi:hypothetical protein